jgi:hypothetical protein
MDAQAAGQKKIKNWALHLYEQQDAHDVENDGG